MRVIDLTHTIKADMPVYPGTGTPKLEPANTYEENGFRETLVSFYSHTGTHMDPPAYLFAGRTTLDAFPASQFLGCALVIDCTHLKEGEAITMKELRKYGGAEDTVDFLLFYLGWDARWGKDSYFGEYPCIDEELPCGTFWTEAIRASASM